MRQQKVLLPIPHIPINFPDSEERAIPSSVLILLFMDDGEIRFILTERTHDVHHHKGQISLPGGTWEEGEHLRETAERETEEEIGIPIEKIQIVAELTPLFVKITGYMIHPFVGYIPEIPKIVPDPAEVNDVFTVTLADLINPTFCKTELQTMRNIPVDVPYFQFGKYKVWGATAMILSEFRACLETIL